MNKLNTFFFYDFKSNKEKITVVDIIKKTNIERISGMEMFYLFRMYNKLLFDNYKLSFISSIYWINYIFILYKLKYSSYEKM